jgi:tetratricopeptide (TPR) repeat protein
MQVHIRHDHSLRIPRPDLDAANDSPNACTSCHTDHTAQWATAQLKSWFGHLPEDHHEGALLLAARGGVVDSAAIAFAAAPSSNAMLRASILSYLGENTSAKSLDATRAGLHDADPLIRFGALRALTNAAPSVRYDLAWSLLADPVKAIRIDAARLLAVIPQMSLSAAQRAQLARTTSEWVESQKEIADRPESAFNIATLRLDQGDAAEAEEGFRTSLKIDGDFVPTLLNLADLYRSESRDDEAESLLRRAVHVDPGNADAGYALALTQIRLNRRDDAARILRDVLRRTPDYANAAYALALLDETAGQLDEAASVLAAATRHGPSNSALISLGLRIARGRNNAADIARYSAVQSKMSQ